MGILSKNGDRKNRASSIIADINKNKGGAEPEQEVIQGEATETPQVQEQIQVEEPTPQVETPTEDSPEVENPENGAPETVQPEPTPSLAEVDDQVILSKLSETLGRKIESYDDLKPKEIAVDPELKQLMEWKEKTGLSLTQFSDYNKDYSKMSDLDVAREILSEKYPSFTKEQLDFELRDLMYDEDIDDDSDKMRKSIKLTKLATEGRQSLESKKLELKPINSVGLSEEQKEAIDFASTMKTAQAQAETSQKQYESNLNSAAKNLDTLTLNLDEGISIEHKLDEGTKNGLKDYILNVPHWFNQDGSPNHKSIASDGYKIKNFDNLLKLAFEQGKSVQKELEIKGKGNIDLDTQPKPQGGDQTKKGNIHSVVDKLSGKKESNFRFRKRN